nr:retrovirus-related Pol polyprotein from transposon TNT 1-94 [Tanacetum cinerariifolium]
KLLEDLHIIDKELAEYVNSPSWDCPTFFSDNEDHFVQYKEYLENPFNKIAASNSNQEKEKSPQDSNIQFHCMHDNVDDLIESDFNSKLLSINLESQRLDKKKQEVKNVIEQPTECGTRIAKSLQNFRVIHNSSTSLKNTSQISPVHAITPILPTEEPGYSLSMGYEHLSTISETESDEVTESSAKNLLPIPSEYEVTSDDETRGNKPGSLFMVEIPSDGINITIDGGDNTALWHQRLGHMSEKSMKILASKGRIQIYIRKAWVYFLKNKSEVFNTFKKWKAIMENETNLRVKCLKSDNGGEYSSREFIEYYVENGIMMLKTVSETPQPNGVAKRMNRTLNERPKRFRIPKEEWQGKEVSLIHLKMRWDIAFSIRRVTRSSEAEMSHLMRTLYMKPSLAQVKDKIRVRGPKTVGASRIVEDQMKKTLKTASPEDGGFETPRVRRSTRYSRALVRYSSSANYLLLTENGEPESYSEALSSKESVQWKKAINEEMDSLEK